MKALDIIVNGKNYTYVDDVTIDNTSYVLFTNGKNIYVNRYVINGCDTNFYDVDLQEYNLVMEVINI